MTAEPRPRAQRKADALQRLQQEVDCSMASADEVGNAHLVPFSYYWDGARGSTGRSEGEPDVLLEAGQSEPGDADGDREGGPAQQMETR